MKIGIVTLVYAEYPTDLFASVVGKTQHDVHWYIHCHSSDPELEARLIAFCATVSANLTLHRANRGVARSWNDGILEAFTDERELTLVINDDIEFIPGGLDEFVRFLQGYNGIGLGFLHGVEAAGARQGDIVKQDFACFAFGWRAFQAVGAFDENFFPAYSEDTDYITRVQKAQVPFVVDDRVLVQHARNKTTRVSPEVRGIISAAKKANEDYFEVKWGNKPTLDLYDRPFNAFPLKIEWERRHQPYGEGFDKPELAVLEAERRRIVSSPLPDSRTLGESFGHFQAPANKSLDEFTIVVRTIYKALLQREPEQSAIDFYVAKMLAGTDSIDNLCDIIRSSREYRDIQAARAREPAGG